MEEHHIFEGQGRRKLSEKYGLKVLLCGIECHREGKKSVQKCPETEQKLYEYGQRGLREDNLAAKSDDSPVTHVRAREIVEQAIYADIMWRKGVRKNHP